MGADGGWVSTRRSRRSRSNPNGDLAKAAEVPFEMIRVINLGGAPGAIRRRGSRRWDARGRRGQAGRRRGTRHRWGRERGSQTDILRW
jgi:hypothetical protein